MATGVVFYDGADINKVVAFYSTDTGAAWAGMTKLVSPDGGFTQGVDIRQHKIVGTTITEMSAGEKTARPLPIVDTTKDGNYFKGRIQRDSNTVISLRRYKGWRVYVNGEDVDPGAGGIACDVTDNLIDAAGADAAAAMAASTLYYVYVSNSKATFAPSDLRGSVTAPSVHNGVQYLGVAGNALQWRFVGWVFTNGSTQFKDQDNARNIANYYNRVWKRLYTNPGYVDDNNRETWTTASTTWVNANGGVGHQVSFIANGEDAADIRAQLTGYNSAGSHNRVGIQRDNAGGPVTAAESESSTSDDRWEICILDCYIPTVGRHTAEMQACVSSGTLTAFADIDRNGATADPPATLIIGKVAV